MFAKPGTYGEQMASTRDVEPREPTQEELRHHHLAHVGDQLSRAFVPVNATTWCIDASLRFEQIKGEPMGLSYLKMPRAASTTLAGINKRIAVNYARRNGYTQPCIRHDGNVPGFYYRRRDRLSFLWTFVRHPIARSMSRVGYQYAEDPGRLANTSYVMAALRNSDLHFGGTSEGRGGFQLQYSMITVSDEGSAWKRSDPEKIINPVGIQEQVLRIVQAYDFIGVVERMDESLVALTFILGLDISDVLAFSSKVAGTYESRRIKKRRDGQTRCVRLPKYNMSAPILAFTRSTRWWAEHYGDYVLFAAANRCLEKTIQKIGRDRFDKALQDYRAAKQRVGQMCKPVFPCSDDGIDQSEEASQECYDKS
eukprot:CAMPEP_0119554562 /NCGR_PEP_ID=MMETSP1352-20130426/7025_1 /TAXON_ID=265584 /ORGANISM="Stauroneis constricta, Strain CCMP1120" /LENGTH=366 /DNA_ID=CAMNT_0007601175 /DNA_START=149 /DNA_END=1246 /DNA_ORIENTATION=-